MSWNDLDADDLAKVSFTTQAQGVRIQREPGPPKIYVEADTDPDTKPMLLRTSKALHDRLERVVNGNRSVALQALIEEALDRLETGHECWRVIARDIG